MNLDYDMKLGYVASDFAFTCAYFWGILGEDLILITDGR